MIFFYASVGVVVLGGAFYAGKHWSLPWLKRKCTATTKGYYIFYEKDSRVQVEKHLMGVTASIITPVYEYNVDGQPYFAEIVGNGPDQQSVSGRSDCELRSEESETLLCKRKARRDPVEKRSAEKESG